MTEVGPNYIGADELVFNNDKEEGIYSGGFSVKSIMMKAGMSPIMTLNYNTLHHKGGANEAENVSDLFNDLVVPNWALSYNDRIMGGKYNEDDHHKKHKTEDYDDSEEEDDIVSDDLHEKLLDLVKEHNAKVKNEPLEKEDGEKEEKNGKKKRVTRKKSSKGKRVTRKHRRNKFVFF